MGSDRSTDRLSLSISTDPRGHHPEYGRTVLQIHIQMRNTVTLAEDGQRKLHTSDTS